MTSKLVHGVGINDLKVNSGQCKIYDRWVGMLRRCYSEAWHKKHPCYIGVKVCDDWLTFSNFKSWVVNQDWEGNHLDKDLIGTGLLYSPDNCLFISEEVNKFIKTSPISGKSIAIGVKLDKRSGKYEARTKCHLTKKYIHIGTFLSEGDAYKAWLAEKLRIAKLISEKQSDNKVANAIIKLYAAGEQL